MTKNGISLIPTINSLIIVGTRISTQLQQLTTSHGVPHRLHVFPRLLSGVGSSLRKFEVALSDMDVDIADDEMTHNIKNILDGFMGMLLELNIFVGVHITRSNNCGAEGRLGQWPWESEKNEFVKLAMQLASYKVTLTFIARVFTGAKGMVERLERKKLEAAVVDLGSIVVDNSKETAVYNAVLDKYLSASSPLWTAGVVEIVQGADVLKGKARQDTLRQEGPGMAKKSSRSQEGKGTKVKTSAETTLVGTTKGANPYTREATVQTKGDPAARIIPTVSLERTTPSRNSTSRVTKATCIPTTKSGARPFPELYENFPEIYGTPVRPHRSPYPHCEWPSGAPPTQPAAGLIPNVEGAVNGSKRGSPLEQSAQSPLKNIKEWWMVLVDFLALRLSEPLPRHPNRPIMRRWNSRTVPQLPPEPRQRPVPSDSNRKAPKACITYDIIITDDYFPVVSELERSETRDPFAELNPEDILPSSKPSWAEFADDMMNNKVVQGVAVKVGIYAAGMMFKKLTGYDLPLI